MYTYIVLYNTVYMSYTCSIYSSIYSIYKHNDRMLLFDRMFVFIYSHMAAKKNIPIHPHMTKCDGQSEESTNLDKVKCDGWILCHASIPKACHQRQHGLCQKKVGAKYLES